MNMVELVLFLCSNHLNFFSAGIGRTGTFISIDNILEQLEEEKIVDVPGVITKMRQRRMKMVQTPVSHYHMLWIELYELNLFVILHSGAIHIYS